MKTLDDARHEASAAALAKARLRHAQEHRVATLERLQKERVAKAHYYRDKVRNGGIWLRRCLNPECLCWFASATLKANWCSVECSDATKAIKRIDKNQLTSILARHAMLVSRRNAGIYDTPKPTPYAIALVAKIEAGDSAIEDVLHAASVQAEQRLNGVAGFVTTGLRSRGQSISYQEPVSSFAEAWFIIGCDISAAHPHRPCDHSGFRLH